MLYEVVDLQARKNAVQFMESAESKPILASYVKTLRIHPSVGYWQARRVLSVCTMLTDLACWISEPRLRPFLASQRPGRLSFMPSGLSYATENSQPDFESSFYSQVTHLHFTDRWELWVTWAGFHLLPNITHIAFVYDDTSVSDDTRVVSAIRGILARCPLLKICVLLHVHTLSPEFDLIDDMRFLARPFPRQIAGRSSPFANRSADLWYLVGV